MTDSIPRRLAAFAAAGILLAALAAWFLVANTGSAVGPILVDPADTTSDGGGCGTVVNPCNNLQNGVNNAASGDTIILAPGTYTGNANVNKSVTIDGPNFGVDPRTTSCAPVLPQAVFNNGTTISANNVVIDGITVDSVPAFPGDVIGAGLYYVPTASGYVLKNSVINNNSIGVYFNSDGLSPSRVQHNCITNNNLPGPAGGNGFYSDQGLGNLLIYQNYSQNNSNAGYLVDTLAAAPDNISIDDNDMVSDGDIAFFQTKNSTITNNRSTNSPYMMVFLGGGNDNISIQNNTGTDDAGGVTLSDIGYGPNNDTDIFSNTFDGDGASGTLGIASAAGTASGSLSIFTNTLTDDRQGVFIDGGGTTFDNIVDNNITRFFQATGDATAIRVVNASSSTSISSNFIDGGHIGSCSGGFWGIYVANGVYTVNANAVFGIGNGLTSGCQEGRSIEAAGSGNVSVSQNNVTTYQKSGIIVRDTVNSTITDNGVTGEGATTAIAQNGITVTSGGTAGITNNQTSNNWYTPDSDQSCGILYFPTVAPAVGALTVANNTSTGDEDGICVLRGTTSSYDAFVEFNTVTAFKVRGIYLDGLHNASVRYNSVDGQGNGTSSSPGTDPDSDVRYYGIFAVDSIGGSIDSNVVHGITHGPSSGLQSGVGIRFTARAGVSAGTTILDNTVYDYQKGGIVVTNVYGGTSVLVGVYTNIVTGSGPVSYIAQNGIQVSDGATGTVSFNDVSDNSYIPSTVSAIGILFIDAGTVSGSLNLVHDNMEGVFVQSSAMTTFNGNYINDNDDTGLFVFSSSGGTYDDNKFQRNAIGLYNADGANNMYSNSFVDSNGTGIVIDGVSNNVDVLGNNIFSNTQDGMDVQPFGSDNPTNIEAHTNCIANNSVFGMSNTATQQVDAENNWWGASDGPGPVGPGSGDNVTTNIDFTPFLTSPTNPGCPSNPTPTPVVTNSPTPVVTNSPTPVPTNSPTPVVTNSPTPVVTNSPTPHVTNSPTPVPTNSPTPVVTPSPTALGGSQTPHPTGAVGGLVDVVTTGGAGTSGGLSVFALLAILVAITAVSGSGLYVFVRRRY